MAEVETGDSDRREAPSTSRILFLVAIWVAILGVAGSLVIALWLVPVSSFPLFALRLFIGPAIVSVALAVVGLVVRSREQRGA